MIDEWVLWRAIGVLMVLGVACLSVATILFVVLMAGEH